MGKIFEREREGGKRVSEWFKLMELMVVIVHKCGISIITMYMYKL